MEYIERDAAKRNAFRYLLPNGEQSPKVVFVDAIDKVPAADVAPVVRCAECRYNNACLTQSFVEDASRIPFDRNTFFCADGVRQR